MESTLFPLLAVLLVILLFIFSLLSRYRLSNIKESSQLLRWGSEMGVFWNTAWQGAVIWITSESETQMTSEKTGYTQSMVSPFPQLPSSESLWHRHVQVLCYKCMVSRSGLDLKQSGNTAFSSSEKSFAAVGINLCSLKLLLLCHNLTLPQNSNSISLSFPTRLSD